MNERKKAVDIGVTCILIYVVNYYLRNVLSVLTPTLLSTGLFDVDRIANLSSTYMLLYAIGQLVNGYLGDALSPKYMISIGLLVSGGSLVVFPFFSGVIIQIICFAFLGFGLSMMRGPLMKIISENTKLNYARIICVFFSFASFAGPIIASFFAMIKGWNWAFICAGAVAVALAVASYVIISVMEAKGVVSYIKTPIKGITSIFAVFKIENIAFYIAVAGLVEISAASIGQWITTFFTVPLGFSKDSANFLFSAISIARSFMPFAALAIFRAIKEKDKLMMRVSFAVSFVAFALLIVSPNRWVSIGLLSIALMAMSCASALLWSVYIPSLGKTGRVSSINGVIDCMGYVVAAGANLIFANVMSNVDWNTVYVLWALVGAIGVAVTFVFKDKKAEE